MRFILTGLILTLPIMNVSAQTDTFIKLNDKYGRHPRILEISYSGDADNLDMYNSLYGHGMVIENPCVAYRIYMDNRG